MTRFHFDLRDVGHLIFLTLISVSTVHADSPIKLHNWVAMSGFSAGVVEPLIIDGTASHLGSFHADGELIYLPGVDDESFIGEGVIVFTAANGDLLAGVVTLEIGPLVAGNADAQLHVSWRDEVQFADGSLVSSTGRFANKRPPGISIRAAASHEWISIPLCITPR